MNVISENKLSSDKAGGLISIEICFQSQRASYMVNPCHAMIHDPNFETVVSY